MVTMLGPFVFGNPGAGAVQAIRKSKAFNQMMHRTDEGFMVGQHGGEMLDNVSLSILFFGAAKELLVWLLEYYINKQSVTFFLSDIAVYGRVRVLAYDFAKVAGRAGTISCSIAIQRILIGGKDSAVTAAIAGVRLASRLFSTLSMIGANVDIALFLQQMGISTASPFVETVQMYQKGNKFWTGNIVVPTLPGSVS